VSLFADSAGRMLGGALDGLSRRQELIAGNLANIDTPGYRPSSIDFEGALRAELENAGAPTPGALRAPAQGPSAAIALRRTDARHLAGSMPVLSGGAGPTTFDGSIRNDGNTVDLESEMTALAESQLRYGAVSRLITAKVGMLRDVARGGR
jgi:flagellar basal-body rod protein FlgB